MDDKRKQILSSYLGINQKITDLTSIGDEVAKVATIFLKDADDQLQRQEGLTLIKEKIKRGLSILKNVKIFEDLNEKYKTIYTLSLTLLVSNLEDYLKEFFINLSTISIILKKFVVSDSIKTSLKEIVDQWDDLPLIFGQLILEKDTSINFQDMQSTIHTYNSYFSLALSDILTKKETDDLIYYQACRHVILHKVSRVDDKFINQIRDTGYSNKYKKGQFIDITLGDYSNAIRVMEKFAKGVYIRSGKVLKP